MNNEFKEILLKTLVIIGSIVSLINLPIAYSINTLFMYIIAFFALTFLVVYFLIKNKKASYDLTSSLALYILFLEILSIPIFAASNTHLLYWIITYPMVIFNLKPTKHALTRSFFLLSIFLFMFLSSFYDSSYTIMQIIIFTMLYTTIVIVFYFISLNIEMKETMLNEQNIELKNQQELYDLVFENSANGILILDPNNHKFLNCNNKIVEILKYDSKDDIIHKNPCQLSPVYQPDGKQSDIKAQEMITQAIQNNSNTFEWKHLRATGEEFWAEITLTSIVVKHVEQIHVVFKDIDERKTAQNELENLNITLSDKIKDATYNLQTKNIKLQESIGNIQNILDTTMEMIVFSDENRKIININQSGVYILGYKQKSEVIGKEIFNFIPTKELSKVQKALKHENYPAYELTVLHKDGSHLHMINRARNIIMNGKTVRISTLMDLTEIKHKEKLLREQSRLAQMGEMISMIAHQWRQPLGAISSSIMSIQTKQAIGKYDLDSKVEREDFLEYINIKHNNINDYVQVLSHTIDDFRNFFQPDRDKELVSLNTPIKRALQIVEASLTAKNIRLDKEFKDDDVILMYQNEMMQVILNIIKNAEDNFEEKKMKNGYIKIESYKEDNRYIIDIRDNGGGIPQNVLPNIFDPYFSTKDEKNGTGLGLYMSKIIIEDHNNGIFSAKNIDDGVRFRIELHIS